MQTIKQARKIRHNFWLFTLILALSGVLALFLSETKIVIAQVDHDRDDIVCPAAAYEHGTVVNHSGFELLVNACGGDSGNNALKNGGTNPDSIDVEAVWFIDRDFVVRAYKLTVGGTYRVIYSSNYPPSYIMIDNCVFCPRIEVGGMFGTHPNVPQYRMITDVCTGFGSNCDDNPSFVLYSSNDLKSPMWDSTMNTRLNLSSAQKSRVNSIWIRGGHSMLLTNSSTARQRCIWYNLHDISQDSFPGGNSSLGLKGNIDWIQTYSDNTCGGQDPDQNGTVDYCVVPGAKAGATTLAAANSSACIQPTPVPSGTPVAAPTPISNPVVTLYAQANYSGALQRLGVGTHDVPNRTYFSMAVEGGKSVTLQAADGRTRCFDYSVNNLQDHESWWNDIDKVTVHSTNTCPSSSSTPVPGIGTVKFYAKANYVEEVLNFGTGTRYVPNRTYFSIDMPSGWSIRLFTEDGSRSRCFNSDVANLQDHEEWYRETRRVDVFAYNACSENVGQLQLFKKANYEDKFRDLNPGEYSFEANTLMFALRFTKSGMSAIFHAPDGRSRCWNSNVTNLQDHEQWWRETIYIKVYNFDACPKPTPPPPPDCNTISVAGVGLFDDTACRGSYVELKQPGIYTLGSFDNQATSVFVKSGWSVLVADSADGTGKRVCFSDHKWDMSRDYYANTNDAVSNTISHAWVFDQPNCPVPPPPDCNTYTFAGIGLFDEKWCQGTSVQLTEPGLFALNNFAKKTTSIYVADGWSLEVFQKSSAGDGYAQCVSNTKWDLIGDDYHATEISIDNDISTVRVYSDSTCGKSQPVYTNCDGIGFDGVVLFDYQYCQGSDTEFSEQTVVNLWEENDTTSSIYVGQGWSARVFEGANGTSYSYCTTDHKWDLRYDEYSDTTSAMNDNISSVEIYHDDHCGYVAMPDVLSPDHGTQFEENTSIILDWTDTAAWQYWIEIWGSGGYFKSVGPLTVSEYQFNGLPSGNYTWRVASVTNMVGSGFAPERQFSVGEPPVENTPPPSTENCNAFTYEGIGLYADSECKGETELFNQPGIYRMTRLNDQTTSIKVAPGWSVEVFEGTSASDGQAQCFLEDKWNLLYDGYFETLNSVNDSITTIKVYHDSKCGKQLPINTDCNGISFDGVMLFDYPYCQGSEEGFSQATATNLQRIDNLASSIFVSPGWSARVSEGRDGTGRSYCATNHKWDFRLDEYSDTTEKMQNSVSYVAVFADDHCGTVVKPEVLQPTDMHIFDDGTAVTLDWTDTAAWQYWIEIWGSGGYFKSVGPLTVSKYTLRDLPDGWYTWRVGSVTNNVGSGFVPDQHFRIGQPQPNCAQIQYDGVILASEMDCKGEQRPFNQTGFYNLDDFDDQGLSIYMGNDWSIMLYQGKNQTGLSSCRSGSMWNMYIDRYWNTDVVMAHTISSIEVFHDLQCGEVPPPPPASDCNSQFFAGVGVYDEQNCQGKEVRVQAAVVQPLNDLVKAASSLYVADGWSAEVFEHTSATDGTAECITQDTAALSPDLDNNISTVKVYQDPNCGKSQPVASGCDGIQYEGIMLFDYANCQGSELGFDQPITTTLNSLDDQATSIFLSPGWSVLVADTVHSQAVCFNQTQSQLGLNNSISFAKVFTDTVCGKDTQPEDPPVEQPPTSYLVFLPLVSK